MKRQLRRLIIMTAVMTILGGLLVLALLIAFDAIRNRSRKHKA
ncbi:hypothetical protein [Aeromicrobium sp. UC242_57]